MLAHSEMMKPLAHSKCDAAKTFDGQSTPVLEEHDGFIILHGTDTMSYSASALSFLLENLDKPVIFTGAQIPIGERRTDATRC